MAERNIIVLFTVRMYDHATWRYATGHPRAGEISHKQMYERVAHSKTYCFDKRTGEIRVG